MTAVDDLHKAAEAYAASTGLAPPTTLAAADDTQLKAASLSFATAEGYKVPPATTPPAGTYDSLVSALKPPEASYSPVKTITSLAALKTALTNCKDGEDYRVQGVTIPGELFVRPKLSKYARFTFDHACVFSGYSGSTWTALPNIYLPDASFIQLIFEKGCQLNNTKGSGFIKVFAGHHIVLDGMVGGQNGGTGLHASPVNGDLSDVWARGEFFDCGHNHAWDPHAEPGTGLHAAYIANGSGHLMHDSMFAIYSHDQVMCGGEVQYGNSVAKNNNPLPYNIKLYVKVARLKFVSTSQTGANGAQLWGQLGKGNTVEVCEADDIQGKAVWVENMYGSPTAEVKVLRGKATNYCQNSRWKGQSPWGKKAGVTYPNPAAMSPTP